MEVRIPKLVFEAHRHFLLETFFLDQREKDFFRWQSYTDLNLSNYDAETLETFLEHIESRLDIRGAKTLHRDVGVWIKANETVQGLKSARARNCKQARSLLIEFFRRQNRKHIYERLQEGDEGICVAYYVEEIHYQPKRDRDDREFVYLDLVYEEFGVRHSAKIYLSPQDCLGLTPAEMIMKSGHLLETDELRADYEKHLDKYASVKDAIGKQFLAVGIADDQGIDGNTKKRDDWWYSSKITKLLLDKDGEPSKVVIDIFREEEKDSRSDRDSSLNTWFWSSQKNVTYGEMDDAEWDPEEDVATNDKLKEIEVPIHPYVACFDLKRHKRLRIHAGNLTEYVFDKTIRNKLVLPERNSKLIDTLLVEKESHFKDVIRGKSGGTIILCQGAPGTGKTLTAEIYSEHLERALYTVQCSQLGTDADELESNLMKVLARGRRWGAVMLLDEADVYVHQRGNDLTQNAIVGVFLRVLEYHSGVLFLTTNRGDLVDDAILSRCTARIPYETPNAESLKMIWKILAEANGVNLPEGIVTTIVREHPKLSGRDVKNLLKLASLVAHDRKCEITPELITEVKIFKPTVDNE